MDGTAYIGLGSNLGDRLGFLDNALSRLEERGAHITAQSRLYETAPMYVTDQPPFLNAAAEIRTREAPRDLLAILASVEDALGRRRRQRFGPRTLDLDILLWGADGRGVVREPDLTIPHPRLLERAFALLPLADVAGDLVHPLVGLTIAELAARSDDSGVVLVDSSRWQPHPRPPR